MPAIEYFYSAHSAFAYLGASRITQIAQAAGRRIIHRPMELGAVVSAARPGGFGGLSKAQLAYNFRRQIERWAEFRGVSFRGGVPENHRNGTILAHCMLIASEEQSQNTDQLAFGMMEAHWKHHADLADPAIVAGVADRVGMNSGELLEAAGTPEIRAALEANTAEAIERSVFGSPTYFVDGDMFYGQDHLELVERALKRPFADNWP